MAEPGAVAIYARISQDRDGDGLGVLRQLQDSREEAMRRGWTVAEEYVDNDISAYSGKERPGYEQMLKDLRSGARDGGDRVAPRPPSPPPHRTRGVRPGLDASGGAPCRDPSRRL